ncbi:hypothetical protein COZ71_02945 [Candidatus Desantisbacteria bacterium CG_4_8_14_3_um_filter_40_12]|uniref:Uncharacterized protein n=2 Tax=unclassified Candidatus Desantisiibacteriota TaxID=3106372 RepID=A0A2M7JDK9_9BACT|nr:MAG: hypothetical protein COX18_07210 [Candidatus Desantisbacteria bacterium CG23_combo_of_CG06-09_8_20_14_all_40_23]PIX17492.1 MAG: hypothetical protein COZ71_02945 [Candidatus Desantisbacteria bacterium CG_4_8_14_3_um_filter_40_12]
MRLTKKNLSCFLLILFLIFIGIGCNSRETENISAAGTIEATEINTNTEINGKITEIFICEGSKVKKGDIIARIDSTIPALQVQQSEAVLMAAREKAKEVKKGNREQVIAQANATVQQMTSLQQGAKQAVGNAKDDLNRIKALFQKGVTTEKQLDDAQTKYETAKAQYESYIAQKQSAQKQLDLLKSGATIETVNIADAGVAQAQNNLLIDQAQLVKTFVYAPAGGIVNSLNYEKGEYISSGAALITIIDTNDLWVNVYISEKNLPNIKIGQKAQIYIDAYPGKPFTGEISFISNKAEFTPKNLQTKEERVNMVFEVKVKIRDDKERLKPGLPADVEIFTR